MTVSYRPSMADNWQYLRYLATRTIPGRCFLALILAMPFAGPVAMYQDSYSNSPLHHVALNSRMQHWLIIASLLMMGSIYILIFSLGLLGLYFATLTVPKTTFTIAPEFCRLEIVFCLKSLSVAFNSPWKQIATVTEEPDYFYFVGWGAASFHIPKRAFDSSAEAEAFFDTALGYWRTAKGIVPPPAPDVSGVWPPAPKGTESQEPGGRSF